MATPNYWMEFFTASNAAQHITVASIDGSLFLATCIAALIRVCRRRLIRDDYPQTQNSSPFENHHENHESLIEQQSSYHGNFAAAQISSSLHLNLAIVVCSLCFLCHCVLGLQKLLRQNTIGFHEKLLSASQALTWATMVVMLLHERREKSQKHSVILRVWWVVQFFVSIWLCAVGIAFLLSSSKDQAGSLPWQDSILSIVTVPVSLYLFVAALIGSTYIKVTMEISAELERPLLPQQDDEVLTGYYKADFLSKLTFSWLNLLLNKGIKKPLTARDVPQLAPDDQADKLHAKLMSSYNQQKEPKSIKKGLLTTFWPQLLLTGFLALLKVCAVYVGPFLIAKFVNFVSGEEAFSLEGVVLVATLLVAKCIEVISSHHFNFNCNKLGMMIRSALITTIYRKGLQLSSLGRQSHGIGQIVNYMSVDVQQVSDSILQLHNIWAVPVHAIIALSLLFNVIGASCFAGLVVMLIILCICFAFAKTQRTCQGKIMFFKDKRMGLTSEVLNSMKIVKMQAWEGTFGGKIEGVRGSERKWLAKFMYMLSFNIFILWLVPSSVSTITFTARLLIARQGLTSAAVFTTISTFRVLQEPMRLFPQSLMSISQALNSLDRIQRFLRTNEVDKDAVERVELDPEAKVVIEIDQGVLSWDKEAGRPTLSSINLSVMRGSLICIVGQVGAGKSTLLCAVLGEVPKLSGKVKVIGSTAYVPQQLWIQNATIEENIRFGKPMDCVKYQTAIRVCCLVEDLTQLEFGDQTEIGERGINLSGGQKQRIQLARAIYQDCDIYLLDDVFSAVDAHTGSSLFKECINGVLSTKTVMLVTHQVDFLHEADQILVMRDGHIVQSGKYEELLEAGLDFKNIVKAHDAAMQLVSVNEFLDVDPDTEEVLLDVQEVCKSPATLSGEKKLERQLSESKDWVPRKLSRRSSSDLKKSIIVAADGKPKKLIEDEERETGQVGWHVYFHYPTKTFKGMHMLAILIFQTGWQGLQLGSDFYLSNATAVGIEQIGYGSFLQVYAGLALGSSAFTLLRSLTVAYSGLLNAQSYFLTYLHAILRAPMMFFDTTPTGRILSRFATDQSNIDVLIPLFMSITLSLIFATAGALIVIIRLTWLMLLIIVPLSWVYIRYQQYYLATSRELTRLDNITKAPMIHHFSETVSGLLIIRAFREEHRFKEENSKRVNSNLRMDFHNNAANEWLGFRLELIGTVILCTSALFMVTIGRETMASNAVGLSLSYGLALNSILYALVFIACQLENKMVSVERINQYSNIPSEAPPVIENRRPRLDWPTMGTIKFWNFQLRYRPDSPLVLKGISIQITGGEKVGVVGRTGSGKSTLIVALFRLVEPASGHIDIDGIDISEIGLRDLRSKVGIIPQDPVLFEGSVRTNMDPQNVHTDLEIWQSLEDCQLADIIKEKGMGLDTPVLDGGENWSMGQRQLFCLGRALLNRTKILLLDEATASVDTQTDAIMQRTIRTHFAESTVISIAHRIATVMDSHKVLVLDSGYVREFNSPMALLEDPSSLFSALVHESRGRSRSIHDFQKDF